MKYYYSLGLVCHSYNTKYFGIHFHVGGHFKPFLRLRSIRIFRFTFYPKKPFGFPV